jgi:hypothetical protein
MRPLPKGEYIFYWIIKDYEKIRQYQEQERR